MGFVNLKTINKLLELLSSREKKRAGLLVGMTLVMAMLDMVGVASIMPFMAVVANPELVETNTFLNNAFAFAQLFGVETTQRFLFVLGVMVFALLLFSLAFKALVIYLQLRFTMMREFSIGKRLIESYLHQPYSWFLSRHSAELGKVILSEVSNVIHHAFMPMMTLIAQVSVATALLTLLIIFDPKLALIVGLTLFVAYSLIFLATRGVLARIGQASVKANQGRFTAVSEAFSASKEVKVGGMEQAYIRRFATPAQNYARHQATAQVISQLPRFALEAIAFGGLLIVVLYLMEQRGSFSSALPIIALYAFTGYRLMPALQQIYGAVAQLRFAGPSLEALHADLMSLKPVTLQRSEDTLTLKVAITLHDVFYSYPNDTQPALKGLNLTIPARSTVGFVGATGSGKTTTVDLILGLLQPQKGTLQVDGQQITEDNLRGWQASLGYVPQQIYLSDDTVSANIAFGQEAKDIDQNAVERAAKIANIHNFVINEMPHQYQTNVGERGVRLSGGQRQRIGIARALYHNPQILIMDEATSSLDNLTEQAVMEAVHNLSNQITIILIAHRLSTVRDCDIVFFLDRGTLTAAGTFDELNEHEASFRAMAAAR